MATVRTTVCLAATAIPPFPETVPSIATCLHGLDIVTTRMADRPPLSCPHPPDTDAKLIQISADPQRHDNALTVLNPRLCRRLRQLRWGADRSRTRRGWLVYACHIFIQSPYFARNTFLDFAKGIARYFGRWLQHYRDFPASPSRASMTASRRVRVVAAPTRSPDASCSPASAASCFLRTPSPYLAYPVSTLPSP